METTAPRIIQASLHLYRTSLVLNNAAVSLLQQGCYDDALKTMTDSLSILKLVFSRQAENAQSAEIANERYHKALARCRRTSETRPCADVTALDEDDYISMKAAVAHGNRARQFFPIRIREIPSDGASSTEATRQFGIILYNHGLMQLLAAVHATCPTKRERWLAGAIKSLQMSQQTYSRLLFDTNDQTMGGEDGQDDCCSGNDVPSLLLFTLTLNCSTHVFLAQNSQQKVQEVQEAMRTLQEQMVEDSHQSVGLFTRDMAPAA
mmetsp:Transcript_37801/g.78478  ORF Transcript_37801/g.78478 Transcript_37801/m.78478 type:complete len:264 (-) Transcript_37801:2102-2893(-)